jgi:hypothetical protein
MKTCTSISGGKTSAYIAANYPSDYNVFALVRTDDKKCLLPDAKLRQVVSDKIGKEFIGTLEDDMIIYTILDLEQYIGKEISWVSGKTFDEVIIRGDKKYLPNATIRFCTQLMKVDPIFQWWDDNFKEPLIMRIGFRANEMRRAKSMQEKTNKDGILEYKKIIGRTKTGNRNKWGNIAWQKPEFPLIKDAIFKDKIEKYWKDKNVRFAYMNNCIGCFHRNEVLLKHMSNKHPNKFQWFIDQEKDAGYGARTFKNGINYEQIKNSLEQINLFDDDFNDCDTGYCGL